jgi:HSP20 family molecular chaperone IbpA
MSFGKFGSDERMQEWSRKIQDIMNEMRNRSYVEYRASGAWQPRVNVYAARAAFHVCIELAGLDPEEFAVECLETTRICLRGIRQPPRHVTEDDLCGVEEMEIDEGAFAREIELPEPVDEKSVEITYDRGFLWIHLPKTQGT